MRITFLSERKNLFSALLIIPIVTALLLFASFEPVQAGSNKNWELIFDQNADGTVKSGTLADLVSAIRSGADVQLIVHEPTTEVMIKPQRVRIDNNGTLVLAVLSENYYNPARTDVVKRFTVFQTTPSVEVTFEQNSGYSNDPAVSKALSWYVNR